jgi:cysteine desulfurase
MFFEQLNNGPCRTYILADEPSGEAALIDPCLEFANDYLKLLREKGWTLKYVIDTHTHADHVSGSAFLRNETGADYVMHRASDAAAVSARVDDDDVLNVGYIPIVALFTPGHSKDSICLVVGDKLFTGDTLFLDDGGAGRDDLYSGDMDAHAASLARLATLPETLIVFPGHDYRNRMPSTLGEQKTRNRYLQFKDAEAYKNYSGSLRFGPAAWMDRIVALNIAGATDAGVLASPAVAAARDLNACEPFAAVAEVAGTEDPASTAFMFVAPDSLRGKLGLTEKIVILDVREADERTGPLGHIPESLHIPLGTLAERIGELAHRKDDEVIVMCKTDNRARIAAAVLLKAGFKNVSVLKGGMTAYRAAEIVSNGNVDEVIYLDHAATTPVAFEVVKAMEPFWGSLYGNPSSLHSIGRAADEAMIRAREKVASLLGASPDEIVFTAGGTESINAAIFGIANRLAPHSTHIITSVIEHAAVLNSCARLEELGYAATYLPVDDAGFINIEELKRAVRPTTTLVSIIYANNEIGTIEPIREIAAALRALNKERRAKGLPKILFHTDACQAAGALEVDVRKLGVDLMTVNGSKLYGPKQTGILYVRAGVALAPVIFGGGQEKNIRSGTENVPGIVGFAAALELAQRERATETARLRSLRNYLADRILGKIKGSRLNGPAIATDSAEHPTRLPNNVNVSFEGMDGETLLMYLDRVGICVSTGSACSAKHPEPSHVLCAIRCPDHYIGGSLRLSLGRTTTKEKLDRALQALAEGVASMRKKVPVHQMPMKSERKN